MSTLANALQNLSSILNSIFFIVFLSIGVWFGLDFFRGFLSFVLFLFVFIIFHKITPFLEANYILALGIGYISAITIKWTLQRFLL